MTDTSTGRMYRTGFERVYDSRAGRRILERLTEHTDPDHQRTSEPTTDGPAKDTA